jgi:hypothetical protein
MANDKMDSSARYPGSSWDTVEHAAQTSDRQPAYLLVLARQAGLPSDRKLAAFAEALHIDVFTARQWLLAPTPRVIRRESRQDRVLEWVTWLRAVGVRGFDLPEAILAEQEFTMPRALRVEGSELRLDFDDNRAEVVAIPDVVCGVWGEVQDRVQTETTTSAIGGELLQGHSTSLTSELVLDLHRRDSPISIRIAQDHMRWSTMFPDESGQSSMHMRRLLKQVRATLRGVAIHEDFGRAEPVLGTTRELLGDSTFLRSNWLGGGGRLRLQRETTHRESGRATFSIYTTLLRWETLRLGPLG